MTDFLFYWSLAYSICLLAGWGAYSLALKGASVRQRHFTLALVYGVSLVLSVAAVVHFRPQSSVATVGNIAIGTPEVTALGDEGISLLSFVPDFIRYGAMIYVAGVLVCLIRLFVSFLSLLYLNSRSVMEMAGGIIVYRHHRSDLVPFSFGGSVYLPQGDFTEDEYRMIVAHESAHVRRRHWLEVLFCELSEAFTWYNPASWRLCSCVKDIHEYEADSDVLSLGVVAEDYQMMLIKRTVGNSFHTLANSLNHSSLKKRITMMLNSRKSARGAWVRTLALVPAFALALAAVNSDAFASARPSAHKVTTFSSISEEPQDDKVVQTCEVMPQYPGGELEMMKFLIDNIVYPEEAMKKGESGRCIVQFIVDKSGKVRDAKVMRGVSPSLDKEALRVVNKLPDFKPGTTGGKPVSVSYVVPVQFKLKSDSKANTEKK